MILGRPPAGMVDRPWSGSAVELYEAIASAVGHLGLGERRELARALNNFDEWETLPARCREMFGELAGWLASKA
jgi:hypothetical protein